MPLLFTFLSFQFSISAFAYVPPVSFILSEAEKAHDAVKTIVMEGIVTDLRNQTSLRELVRIDFVTGNLSVAYFNGNEPEGTYESHVKDIHRLGKFWITLGIDPSAARFKQALQELNALPTEKTEAILNRMGDVVTWSWGEDPVVQFVKDDFFPADYLSGGKGTSSEEILISEYTSPSSSVRVPKTVILKFKGKDTYRFDVKSVKINQVLKFTANAGNTLKSPLAKDWVTLVR